MFGGRNYAFNISYTSTSISSGSSNDIVLTAYAGRLTTWAMMLLGFAGPGLAGYRRGRCEGGLILDKANLLEAGSCARFSMRLRVDRAVQQTAASSKRLQISVNSATA